MAYFTQIPLCLYINQKSSLSLQGTSHLFIEIYLLIDCSGRFLFNSFKSHLNDTILHGDLTHIHFHSLNNSIIHRCAIDVPFILADEDSMIQHQHIMVEKHFASSSSQLEQSRRLTSTGVLADLYN